jgi:hypothetical protein
LGQAGEGGGHRQPSELQLLLLPAEEAVVPPALNLCALPLVLLLLVEEAVVSLVPPSEPDTQQWRAGWRAL